MSKRPADAVCANCVFWLSVDPINDTGQCRVDPPYDDHAWYDTSGGDWCGHFSDDWEVEVDAKE